MNMFPLIIIMKVVLKKWWGNRVGFLYLASRFLEEKKKKDGKKHYLSPSLSLRCLSHDKFYSDTLAQSSIFSLPAQCSLNFNETLFPKFTAKCTYPTNVTISNFTCTSGRGKNLYVPYFFFLIPEKGQLQYGISLSTPGHLDSVPPFLPLFLPKYFYHLRWFCQNENELE